MTGPEHYLEAERLIVHDDVHDPPTAGNIALAQVHATLALAAATAMGAPKMHSVDVAAWDRVCGVQNPCPRCQGPSRRTTGMVCQACGRDYGEGGDP